MSHLKILLAEDNLINQKLMLIMLKKLGYCANVAGNGAEVLAALGNEMYDLILMDIQMPYMDGIDATRVIRKKWLYGPKIVIITAFSLESYREACLDAGADDFVTKPIKIEELKEAIERNAIMISLGTKRLAIQK